MEYGGRQGYQDPHSYYYNSSQPPPLSVRQQTGPGSARDGNDSQGYPPAYPASERPSPPPTPLSATTSTTHMSAPMPHNIGRSMSDHMYHPRSEEASGSRRTTSPMEGSVHNSGNRASNVKRVGGKANVSSACAPCKKAHLACDVMRPCKRCVNMGKEDMCEDVPHKKRGRPKVNKAPLGAPYQRVRPHGDDISAQYRQPLPPPFPPPSSHPNDPVYHQLLPPPLQPYPGYRQPTPTSQPPPPPVSTDPPGLFTVFTTLDLRIIRATNGCANLIGYHPEHLLHHSLLDWIHPADRSILDNERIRLITLPHGPLHASHRDLFPAIQQRSERELLSPAEGMQDQYPNQNVRLVRTDQQYNFFNVRLHLGGGLGASLVQPETHDRIYLVVSCLLVPNQQVPPLVRASSVAPTTTSNSPYGPPTPITPMTIGPPIGGLPSFSSIAAGVDVPQMRYGATPYPSRPNTGPQQYSSSSGYYPPRGQQAPAPSASLPPVQTTMYPKSPSPQYRQQPDPSHRDQNNDSSYPPYDYPPPLPSQGYYLDDGYRQHQTQNQNQNQAVQENWRRRPAHGDIDPSPSISHESHPGLDTHPGIDPTMQTPTSAIPIDYSRRPWET